MTRRLTGAVAALLLGASASWAVADATDLMSECAGCHAIERPADPAGLPPRSERHAPSLYHAGSKFRAQWLAQWLQQPSRLRPAGYFPPQHTVHGDAGDEVDPSTLSEHPALDERTAQAVTDHLMTLRDPDLHSGAEGYTPGSVALRMGMLDFRKFKGCNACHQDVPEEGGVSGPELYTAWQRLQPAFIFSYIQDPTRWDADSMMPVPGLNDAAVAKLADYLKVIGENAQ